MLTLKLPIEHVLKKTAESMGEQLFPPKVISFTLSTQTELEILRQHL